MAHPTNGDHASKFRQRFKGSGISEIVAVNRSEFLVLERDGSAGENARVKRNYAIGLGGASDISALAALPTTGIPDGVIPVSKRLVIDLLDLSSDWLVRNFPRRSSRLRGGPDLSDGRHLLVVLSDNDFSTANPTQAFAFALPAGLFSASERQILEPRIDVLPFDSSAVITPLAARAGVPVAIFGSELFDVSQIDRASITLSGTNARSVHGKKTPCRVADLDRDEIDDLVCLVDARRLGAIRPPHDLAVSLTATTSSGSPIRGEAILHTRWF